MTLLTFWAIHSQRLTITEFRIHLDVDKVLFFLFFFFFLCLHTVCVHSLQMCSIWPTESTLTHKQQLNTWKQNELWHYLPDNNDALKPVYVFDSIPHTKTDWYVCTQSVNRFQCGKETQNVVGNMRNAHTGHNTKRIDGTKRKREKESPLKIPKDNQILKKWTNGKCKRRQRPKGKRPDDT